MPFDWRSSPSSTISPAVLNIITNQKPETTLVGVIIFSISIAFMCELVAL